MLKLKSIKLLKTKTEKIKLNRHLKNTNKNDKSPLKIT